MNYVVCRICISCFVISNSFLFGIIFQQAFFLVYQSLCCMKSTKIQLMISWLLHTNLLGHSPGRLILCYVKSFLYLQRRRRRHSRLLVIPYLPLCPSLSYYMHDGLYFDQAAYFISLDIVVWLMHVVFDQSCFEQFTNCFHFLPLLLENMYKY